MIQEQSVAIKNLNQEAVLDKIRMTFTDHMGPDFGKLTTLSHLVFQEIPISNIKATVVLLS